MSARLPWHTGYTPGGALGIWSKGCRADEPDVCFVVAVPDDRDIKRGDFIVLACNSYHGLVSERDRLQEQVISFSEGRGDARDTALREAARDVCALCAGREAPGTFSRVLDGPNKAGNYVHARLRPAGALDMLCPASAIWSRINYEARRRAALAKVSK